MPRKLLRIVATLVLLLVTISTFAQHHKSGANSPLDQYVEQVSELSSRARANVYFANPQSVFRGVQVNFVDVGAGNLTFLRRDLVAAGRIPLVFARVYDSSGKGSVDFGPGWSLSAAESITVSDDKAHLFAANLQSSVQPHVHSCRVCHHQLLPNVHYQSCKVCRLRPHSA
jgi:hypothetical protein